MSTKRVWVVDDGETHHVVATSADEAIEAVASAFDHDERYREEYEPSTTWAPLAGTLKINITEATIGCRDDYPPGTQFFAEATMHRIAEHMTGVVCSSVW